MSIDLPKNGSQLAGKTKVHEIKNTATRSFSKAGRIPFGVGLPWNSKYYL